MGRLFCGTAPSVAALIFSASIPTDVAFGDDPSSPPPVVDEAETIREIFDQVAAQREEIFSAKITYRWHLATYRNPDNTPDHVRALLHQYDLIGDPDSLADLVHTLVPKPTPPDPPWETRTFHMLGEKRRADTSRNLIQLVDDDREMTYMGMNEQLTIDQRGKSSIHFTAIRDFRCDPPSPRYGLKAEDYRVIDSSADDITLEMIPSQEDADGISPYQYTFDRATGVLTHYKVTHDDGLAREVWQLGLTEYPGGIVIPALRLVTMYRQGRLNSLRVFIIEEAELNGPISEDLFIMPVPAGTLIVDGRFAKKQVRRIKEPTDDVRSVLVPVSRPVPRIAGSKGPNWRMVLILNGVALIVFATVLWRKASLSAAHSAPANPPRPDLP